MARDWKEYLRSQEIEAETGKKAELIEALTPVAGGAGSEGGAS